MRVLFVTRLFAPSVGGIQTYVDGLSRALAGKCDLTLMAPGPSSAGDAKLPYPVVRVPPGEWAMPASTPIAVPLVAARGRFDASLHVEWTTAHAGIWARRAGLVGRVLSAVHGNEILHLRPDVIGLRTIERWRRDWTLARVDRLLPVSAFTARLLVEQGVDPTRITVVHNGVDPGRFRPVDRADARRRLGLPEAPTLLSLGRLVGRKGFDLVLRALREVHARVPAARAVIAGDGPERARLEALAAELGLAGAVEFRGKVVDDDVVSLYGACDVFVLPVRDEWPSVEGFGIVYLEAGACGRPVVATRAGGAPEAVRDGVTGILVAPDDPFALARALVELLTDPARARRLGEAGREHVLSSASWDHVAERVLGAMGD